MERLTPQALAAHLAVGGRVVDVREPAVFADAHIRGALNVALANRSAPYWVHALVGPAERVAVVTATEREGGPADELLAAAERAAKGFLPFEENAFRAAGVAIASFRTLTPEQLAETRDALTVVDVREAQEYALGHVPGALLIPLGELAGRVAEIPAGPIATICASGFRSSTGASLLEAAARSDLASVWGGTTAWMQLGLPVDRGSGR